ncbi:uncharacterized protein [Miscanthus floridulus]|uniref:uncharacterized protein n=1 Tax=Miscanthus floridulus TaxID=154761 RepID=UPI00345ADF32
MTHDAWKNLEESYEGTQAIKGAKAYILKEKFASFKIKEDESVSEMFDRLQVLVNDLKLVRSGLNTMTPNQILRDVMTDDTYRDDNEKEEKKDEKKKSVAFKAASSSKGKSKAKQEASSEDEGLSTCDDEDDEKMALFMKRFDKFMMKKGYHVRRNKSSSKNKDEPRKCFKCNSKDHLIAEYPYNSDNDDDNKKSKKKEKKEKKESKMTFKKKNKGGS